MLKVYDRIKYYSNSYFSYILLLIFIQGQRMDIANLQAFVAIAESGSFSQAAEKLFLTQPAISKRIAQLESELGVKLFDRIGRRTTLTEAGQTLHERARAILLELEDTRRAIGNLSQVVGGHLIVGTSHHIALHRLSPALKRFNRDYPRVELDLRFLDSETVCSMVEQGEFELGIVSLPDTDIATLSSIPIWTDELVIVCGETHPLGEPGSMGLKDLLQHQAILPAPKTYTRAIIERGLQHPTQELKVRLNTNNLETIKVLVEAGLGWSVLPRTMLSDQLIELQIPGIHMTRQLGFVIHKERTLSHAAQALMDIIKNS
jgi:DNA-binding transcriptional LysR family regulator